MSKLTTTVNLSQTLVFLWAEAIQWFSDTWKMYVHQAKLHVHHLLCNTLWVRDAGTHVPLTMRKTKCMKFPCVRLKKHVWTKVCVCTKRILQINWLTYDRSARFCLNNLPIYHMISWVRGFEALWKFIPGNSIFVLQTSVNVCADLNLPLQTELHKKPV